LPLLAKNRSRTLRKTLRIWKQNEVQEKSALGRGESISQKTRGEGSSGRANSSWQGNDGAQNPKE
jgi:hypothetical protein